jgi:hypothetical protein
VPRHGNAVVPGRADVHHCAQGGGADPRFRFPGKDRAGDDHGDQEIFKQDRRRAEEKMIKEYRYPIFLRIVSNSILSTVLILDIFFILLFSVAFYLGKVIWNAQFIPYLFLFLLAFLIPLFNMSAYPDIKINDNVIYYRSFIKWHTLDVKKILSYKIISLPAFVSIGIPHRGEAIVLRVKLKICFTYVIITNAINDYSELQLYLLDRL